MPCRTCSNDWKPRTASSEPSSASPATMTAQPLHASSETSLAGGNQRYMMERWRNDSVKGTFMSALDFPLVFEEERDANADAEVDAAGSFSRLKHACPIAM